MADDTGENAVVRLKSRKREAFQQVINALRRLGRGARMRRIIRDKSDRASLHDDHQQFAVREGDIIYLVSNDLGPRTYLYADRCTLRISLTQHINSLHWFDDCLWRVVPNLQYDDADPEHSKATNEALLRHLETDGGDRSLYGNIIQLQHVSTGLFLTVVDDPVSGRTSLVSLTPGDEASYLAIKPKFKAKLEGGLVLYTEQIFLKAGDAGFLFGHLRDIPLGSMNFPANLPGPGRAGAAAAAEQSDDDTIISQLELEINEAPTSFAVHFHKRPADIPSSDPSDSGDAEQGQQGGGSGTDGDDEQQGAAAAEAALAGALRSGCAVRLFHPESISFLSGTRSQDMPGLRNIDDGDYENPNNFSSEDVWVIETVRADSHLPSLVNQPLDWKTEVRLRHAVTGRYLCMQQVGHNEESPVLADVDTFADYEAGGDEVDRTNFRLLPAEASAGDYIPALGTLLVIENMYQNGRWRILERKGDRTRPMEFLSYGKAPGSGEEVNTGGAQDTEDAFRIMLLDDHLVERIRTFVSYKQLADAYCHYLSQTSSQERNRVSSTAAAPSSMKESKEDEEEEKKGRAVGRMKRSLSSADLKVSVPEHATAVVRDMLCAAVVVLELNSVTGAGGSGQKENWVDVLERTLRPAQVESDPVNQQIAMETGFLNSLVRMADAPSNSGVKLGFEQFEGAQQSGSTLEAIVREAFDLRDMSASTNIAADIARPLVRPGQGELSNTVLGQKGALWFCTRLAQTRKIPRERLRKRHIRDYLAHRIPGEYTYLLPDLVQGIKQQVTRQISHQRTEEVWREAPLWLLQRLVFRALQQTIFDNRMLEFHFVQNPGYVDLLLEQAPHPVGAALCFSQLISNNRALIEKYVNVHVIDTFIRFVRKYGPSHRFLEFFIAICSCSGEQVLALQERTIRRISLAENLSSIVVRTSDTKAAAPQCLLPDGSEHTLTDEIVLGDLYRDTELEGMGDGFRETMHDIERGSFTAGETTTWRSSGGLQALLEREGDLLPGHVNKDGSPQYLFHANIKGDHKSGTSYCEFTFPRVRVTWHGTPKWQRQRFDGGDGDEGGEDSAANADEQYLYYDVQTVRQNAEECLRVGLYFERQLDVFAEMCLGRSYNAIILLQKEFTMERVMAGIVDETLPFQIRASFANLMHRLWIDRAPHEANCGRATIPERIWIEHKITGTSDITLPTFHNIFENAHQCKGFQLDEDLLPSNLMQANDSLRFYMLQEVLSDHMTAISDEQDSKASERNIMTGQLLLILEKLISFGMYGSPEEIADVWNPLMDCTSRNTSGDGEKIDLWDAMFAANGERDLTDDMRTYLQCKMRMVQTFSRMLLMRAHYLTANALCVMRDNEIVHRMHHTGPQKRKRSTLSHLPFSANEHEFGPLGRQLVGEQMAFLSVDNLPAGQEPPSNEEVSATCSLKWSDEALLQLMMHDMDDLFQHTFSLLRRRYRQYDMALEALGEALMLPSSVVGAPFHRFSVLDDAVSVFRAFMEASETWAVTNVFSGQSKDVFTIVFAILNMIIEFLGSPSPLILDEVGQPDAFDDDPANSKTDDPDDAQSFWQLCDERRHESVHNDETLRPVKNSKSQSDVMQKLVQQRLLRLLDLHGILLRVIDSDIAICQRSLQFKLHTRHALPSGGANLRIHGEAFFTKIRKLRADVPALEPVWEFIAQARKEKGFGLDEVTISNRHLDAHLLSQVQTANGGGDAQTGQMSTAALATQQHTCILFICHDSASANSIEQRFNSLQLGGKLTMRYPAETWHPSLARDTAHTDSGAVEEKAEEEDGQEEKDASNGARAAGTAADDFHTFDIREIMRRSLRCLRHAISENAIIKQELLPHFLDFLDKLSEWKEETELRHNLLDVMVDLVYPHIPDGTWVFEDDVLERLRDLHMNCPEQDRDHVIRLFRAMVSPSAPKMQAFCLDVVLDPENKASPDVYLSFDVLHGGEPADSHNHKVLDRLNTAIQNNETALQLSVRLPGSSARRGTFLGLIPLGRDIYSTPRSDELIRLTPDQAAVLRPNQIGAVLLFTEKPEMEIPPYRSVAELAHIDLSDIAVASSEGGSKQPEAHGGMRKTKRSSQVAAGTWAHYWCNSENGHMSEEEWSQIAEAVALKAKSIGIDKSEGLTREEQERCLFALVRSHTLFTDLLCACVDSNYATSLKMQRTVSWTAILSQVHSPATAPDTKLALLRLFQAIYVSSTGADMSMSTSPLVWDTLLDLLNTYVHMAQRWRWVDTTPATLAERVKQFVKTVVDATSAFVSTFAGTIIESGVTVGMAEVAKEVLAATMEEVEVVPPAPKPDPATGLVRRNSLTQPRRRVFSLDLTSKALNLLRQLANQSDSTGGSSGPILRSRSMSSPAPPDRSLSRGHSESNLQKAMMEDANPLLSRLERQSIFSTLELLAAKERKDMVEMVLRSFGYDHFTTEISKVYNPQVLGSLVGGTLAFAGDTLSQFVIEDVAGVDSKKASDSDKFDMWTRRLQLYIRRNFRNRPKSCAEVLRFLSEVLAYMRFRVQKASEAQEALEDTNPSIAATEFMEVQQENVESAHQEIQDRLTAAGFMGLIYDIMGYVLEGDDALDDLFAAALLMGTEMLEAGFDAAQDSLYRHVAVADPDGRFFRDIKNRIRKAKNLFMSAQFESLSTVAVLTEDFGREDELLVCVLFRFLTQCCEGHNLAMQRLLQDQTTNGNRKTFDIVFEAVMFANEVSQLIPSHAKDVIAVARAQEEETSALLSRKGSERGVGRSASGSDLGGGNESGDDGDDGTVTGAAKHWGTVADALNACFSFIAEALQGPCLVNQEIVAKAGLADTVRSLLNSLTVVRVDKFMKASAVRVRAKKARSTRWQRDELFRFFGIAAPHMELSSLLVATMRATLEGRNDKRVHGLLRHALPEKSLSRLIEEGHKMMAKLGSQPLEAEGLLQLVYSKICGQVNKSDEEVEKEAKQEEIMETWTSFVTDLTFLHNQLHTEAELSQAAGQDLASVEVFFKDHTETVYFNPPEKVDALRTISMRKFTENVEITNRDTRLREFAEAIPYMVDEMDVLSAMMQNAYLRMINAHFFDIKVALYGVAVLLNFNVLLEAEKPGAFYDTQTSGGKILTPILAGILIVGYAILLMYSIRATVPLTYKKLRRQTREVEEDMPPDEERIDGLTEAVEIVLSVVTFGVYHFLKGFLISLPWRVYKLLSGLWSIATTPRAEPIEDEVSDDGSNFGDVDLDDAQAIAPAKPRDNNATPLKTVTNPAFDSSTPSPTANDESKVSRQVEMTRPQSPSSHALAMDDWETGVFGAIKGDMAQGDRKVGTLQRRGSVSFFASSAPGGRIMGSGDEEDGDDEEDSSALAQSGSCMLGCAAWMANMLVSVVSGLQRLFEQRWNDLLILVQPFKTMAIALVFFLLVCVVHAVRFPGNLTAYLVLGLFVFAIWFLRSMRGFFDEHRYLYIPKKRRDQAAEQADEAHKQLEYDSSTTVAEIISFVYDTITFEENVWLIILWLLAVVGLYRVWALPFILLDLITISADVKNILYSVTQPIKSLGLLLFMFLVSILLFSSVATAAWPYDTWVECEDDGCPDDLDDDEPAQTTRSPLENFLLFINAGDAIGEFMDPVLYKSGGIFGYTMLFQQAHFIIIGVLMFDMVTGIIVDTFGSLREDLNTRRETEEDENFISGITREKSDELNIDFDALQESKQNMWRYLHFVAYILDKDPTEHDGLESHVFEHIERGDNSWFPRHTCVAMEEEQSRRAAEEDAQKSVVEDVARRLTELQASQERLREAVGVVAGRIADATPATE